MCWPREHAALYAAEAPTEADALGISVPQMEAKLRGDAELLSWLLATPVGVALYGLSRSTQ